jgi:hypothetical protein
MSGEVVEQDGQAKIASGQTHNYVLNQPESAASIAAVPPEPDDAWNQKRDNYNDQYAATGGQFSGSEDPNAYGNADLANYGNYSEIPGYGVMWQPNEVTADWDPFGYGAWSYYPDWGWTFVSGYPWGWAPFYFGDWCYINGRGWWWRPGPWHGHGPGQLPGHFPGSWHPQPLYASHPAGNWNAPHAPSASSGRDTVAVAGSHLRVGPIAETHATMATTSGARTTGSIVSGSSFATRTGTPAGGPAGRVGVPSSLVRGSVVVGQKGSYSLASGVQTGHNGYEVHRGNNSTPRVTATAPRSYSYQSTGPALRNSPGPSSTSSSAPPVHAAPVAPASGGTPHISSAPAPHVSSGGGGGGSVHSGGGGGGGASHSGGGGGGGGHR